MAKRYSIMLLGKTGRGKTAISSRMVEGSITYQHEPTTFVASTGICTSSDTDTILEVIDSPGLFSNCYMDERKGAKQMLDYMEEAIDISRNGIDAFAIVLRYGIRYTDEEQKVVRNLKSIFGSQFFEDHVIVIFTYGEDYHSRNNGEPFEHWVDCQMGKLTELVEMCGRKCLLFENVRGTKETDSEQKRQLLTILSKMPKKFTATDYLERVRHHQQSLSLWQRFYQRQPPTRQPLSEPTELNIVLIDNTGSHKSVIGNRILGEDGFRTPREDMRTKVIGDYCVRVVDTPWVKDRANNSSIDYGKENQEATKYLKTCLRYCNGEIHLFLLVLPFKTDYTEEDLGLVQHLKENIEEELLKRTAVLFAHPHEYETKVRNLETFDLWCRRQTSKLGHLLESVRYRCLLFENFQSETQKEEPQSQKVLDMANTIRTRSGPFTASFLKDGFFSMMCSVL